MLYEILGLCASTLFAGILIYIFAFLGKNKWRENNGLL